MDSYNIHEKYMARAIHLAKKGQGRVSPNPMVGCIIVKNGEIIGEGYHEQFGKPHAEIMAFKNCIKDPTDAALYVSLEPCSHHGKTGPCCNVIAENGIRDVYISMLDPNKNINGQGIEYLKNSGINVSCDILKSESQNLNKGYLHWIEHNKPLVIGKLAQDERGFIAKKGSKVWITGSSSKENSHKLRSEVDAILVGKNTVLIDNPELTVREVIGHNPKRIVLDTNRTLPYDIKLLNDKKSDTFIICSNKKFQDNETSHCKYLVVNEVDDKLDPNDILVRLGQIGITSLIIEGGASTIKSFLDMGLINQFYLYVSTFSKDELDIKNPFSINDDWEVQDKKFLDDDCLTILKKERRMFTGIIKSLGIINKAEKDNKDSFKLEVCVSNEIFNTTNIGDSISINGVCLTVTHKIYRDNDTNKSFLFFDVIEETLNKTNLDLLEESEKVNLETSLKFSDGLDGHIVQGHIDTTGSIINNQLIEDNSWLLEIMIEKKWLKYCIKKGSISIDGISLTIANINENYNNEYGTISISIIPHTFKNTNLNFKNKNDTVNIETDFFGKYIEKLLQPRMEINE